jgi:hypothetical protein
MFQHASLCGPAQTDQSQRAEPHEAAAKPREREARRAEQARSCHW